jgi:Ig-like domain CHU_C associated
MHLHSTDTGINFYNVTLHGNKMKHLLHSSSPKIRRFTSRLGSLILLFQRSPLVQILFPEVKVVGGVALANVSQWTIATMAGLGAYDTIAGATAAADAVVISQISPNAGSSAVRAPIGVPLQFVIRATGEGINPERWTVDGSLPPGLTLSDTRNSSIESITGIPTELGSYSFTTTVWAHADFIGPFVTKRFSITIVDPLATAPVITTQPLSSTVAARSRVVLRVASSDPNATFQWYKGKSGVTKSPIKNAKSETFTFTTPRTKGTSSYWVQVINDNGQTNSATAVIVVTKKRKP